jgi:hypothetical protein
MSMSGSSRLGVFGASKRRVNFLSAAYSELRATPKTTAMLLAGPLVRL